MKIPTKFYLCIMTDSDDPKTFNDLDAFIVGEIVAKLDPRDRVSFAATTKNHWNEYGKNTIPKTFPEFNIKKFTKIFEKDVTIQKYIEGYYKMYFTIDMSEGNRFQIPYIKSIGDDEEIMRYIHKWLWNIYDQIKFLYIDESFIIEIQNDHLQLYIQKNEIRVIYYNKQLNGSKFVVSKEYINVRSDETPEPDYMDIFSIDSYKKYIWMEKDSLPENFIIDCMGLILRIPWFLKQYRWANMDISTPKDHYTQNLRPHLRNRVASWWYQKEKYIYFS